MNPFAIKVLGALGYPTEGYRSKSWDEFAKADAPQMDFVFTVCDSAAGEACPVWPGHPATAHWGIEYPAAVEGAEIEKERAFVQAAKYLKMRISLFLNLPLCLTRQALARRSPARDRAHGRAQRHAARKLPEEPPMDVIIYHKPRLRHLTQYPRLDSERWDRAARHRASEDAAFADAAQCEDALDRCP